MSRRERKSLKLSAKRKYILEVKTAKDNGKNYIKSNFSRFNILSIIVYRHCTITWTIKTRPGDFRSWESPQTLPALFIGPFHHVERFRNFKLVVN